MGIYEIMQYQDIDDEVWERNMYPNENMTFLEKEKKFMRQTCLNLKSSDLSGQLKSVD